MTFFLRIKNELEQETVFFKAGQKQLAEGQEDAVEKVVKQLKEFDSLGSAVKKKYHIEIIGHADGTGNEEQNLQISKERAETLRSILIARGLTAKNFIIKGVGSMLDRLNLCEKKLIKKTDHSSAGSHLKQLFQIISNIESNLL